MIGRRLSRVPGHLGESVLVLMAAGVALGALSCAGPQPLHVAINRHDEDAYRAHLSASAGDAASAYANWMAEERGTTAAKVLEADEQLSTTRSPFDAYRDPEATVKLHHTNIVPIYATGLAVNEAASNADTLRNTRQRGFFDRMEFLGTTDVSDDENSDYELTFAVRIGLGC